jgi:hypothetical protein
LNEHWTLITANKGKLASRPRYESGDFASITFDEAYARFADILQAPLPGKSKEAFDAIRKHRNRLVHFHHAEFTAAYIESILNQLADAWFALYRFMDQWRNLFSDHLHNRRANYNEQIMLWGNEYYSAAKLRHIQPEIDALIKEGENVHVCHTCKCKAVLIAQAEPPIFQSECLVCNNDERFMMVVCSHCKEDQPQKFVAHSSEFKCQFCGGKQDSYELLSKDPWLKKPPLNST